MFNSTEHYLPLPAPRMGAEVPAPCTAPSSSHGGLWEVKKQHSNESCWLAEQNEASHGVVVLGAFLQARFPLPQQLCIQCCIACRLQQKAQCVALSCCTLAQGGLVVTPSPHASSNCHPPRYYPFGSYPNHVPVNPIKKKGRIPIPLPSFVCAFPHLLKSLSIWGPVW